jgi:hypothetical protein
MATQWYYDQQGKSYGPFSADQLIDLAAKGRIQPQDTVWKEGMTKRVLAARVEHLFAISTPPVPPSSVGDPTPLPAPAAEPATMATASKTPTDESLPGGSGGGPPPLLSGPAGSGSGPSEPRRQQQEVRKRRVLGVRGGVNVSDDGVTVRFRKKCPKCGYEDTCVTSMAIPFGSMRVNFFCPKCKRSHPVEVQGMG